jgi:hypothetical protein
MSKSRTPISGASSYAEIGEYWDQHDLSDHWDETKPAEFTLDLHGSSIYFPLERGLAEQLRTAAQAHGVSSETLLNLWVRERVTDELRSK